MGSSPLATDGIDSLCGEYARQQPLLFDRFGAQMLFDARFFLDPSIYPQTDPPMNHHNLLVANGFGDYTHFDGVINNAFTDTKQPRSNSRVIRSSFPSNTSNVHYVKFAYRHDTVNFYPVILT